MTEERKGTLAIVAAAAGYGFLSVLLKLALEAGAGVLPLAAWRFGLAAVFVWILLLVRRRPAAPRDAWPALAGLGAIYAVNALAFVAALRTVPAATATLVFYVYPVVVVLLAALFLGEPFTRRKAIGAALATAGCVLTAGAGLEGGDPRGIALVLLSTLSLSIYIVAGRKLLARLPSHGAAAVVVTAAAIACFAAAAAGGDLRLGGGARAAWIVTLVALVSTALPITLFVIGLKRLGAGRAAIYSTIEPALTVAAAALLLGEAIGWLQVAGGALIVAGVLWLRTARPLPASEGPTPLDAP